MDVRCERCQTEYELDDSSVSEDGTEVQCTACGNTFMVRAVGAPAGSAENSPPTAEFQLETADGKLHRFRNLTSLQKWIIERKVTRVDRMSRTGHGWRRLGEIVELAPFFDVVDQADRGRAGITASRGLGSEVPIAGAAPRRTSARRSVSRSAMDPAPDLETGSERRFGGEGDTAIVHLRTGSAVWKALSATAIGGAVVYLGIAQPWQGKDVPMPEPVAPAQIAAPPPGVLPAPSEVGAVATQAGAVPPAVTGTEGSGSEVGAAPAAGSGDASPSAAVSETDAKPPTVATSGGAAAQKAPPRTEEAPMSYDRMINEADRLLENGGTARAQKLYERALRARSNGIEALAGLGYSALDRGSTAQAIMYFRRALSNSASYGPALFGMAEAYRAAGDDALSLEHYNRYLLADPGGPDASAARRQIKMLENKAAAAAK